MASSVFLLLLLLLAIPSSATAQRNESTSIFWSIDCGGSKLFVNNHNITWVGDGDFVKAGERKAIQDDDPSAAPEMRTLRVFGSNTMKKNCYTVPVGLGVKILVRARFHYGNYDGRQDPPEFELLFDADFWSTVTTEMGTTQRYEVVYVTKRNTTSICVARTRDDHDPFISALEVRTLPMNTYRLADPARAMYSVTTKAYGTNDRIRFPDDKFDRIWDIGDTDGYTVLTATNATAKIRTGINDAPPEKILRAAISPPFGGGGARRNLTVLTSDLPSTAVPMYYTMYFSEVADLSATNDTRSFHVCKDGVLISNASRPLAPPFGSVLEFFGKAGSASNSTVFDLVPAADSTLPPLLNAMEVFWVTDPMSNGTKGTDVEALSVLQGKFDILRNWTGDPCLPESHSWEWVECNITDSGFARITKLQLGGYSLSGKLADFSALDALEIVDLHNNSLTGEIPDFLGKLPRLKELNLADNYFSKIPSSLSERSSIKLIYTGNSKLCQPGKICETGPISAPAPAPAPAPETSPISVPTHELALAPPPTATGLTPSTSEVGSRTLPGGAVIPLFVSFALAVICNMS